LTIVDEPVTGSSVNCFSYRTAEGKAQVGKQRKFKGGGYRV